jgi:two-component system CheB/CheR fusion protein
MQSVHEQHEASTEELQAANEEVTSANEELQSLNEELESSKEELESTNEELTTLNDEMANRNAELSRANSDLINLQGSTKLAVIVLGPDLTIRHFTPEAEQIFNLRPTDVGRPLGNVRHNVVSPDLETIATGVMASVRETEQEVQDKDGHWFSLRVRPYLTIDKKIDVAVLVLVDIDALKRTEHELRAARDFAQNTIDTVREPLVRLDAELRITNANRAFYRTFRTTPDETIGQFIYELGNRQWNSPQLRQLLENILPKETVIEDFEVDHEFQQIGRRIMLLNARRLENQPQESARILLAIEDVTERKRSQRQQEVLVAELKHRTRNLLAFVSAISAQTIATSRSLEDFAPQFGDRLSALSRVQTYLSHQEHKTASIADIVRNEMKAVGSNEADDHIRIEGEDVRLPDLSVQVVALALHELATNALKYGALAGKGGRLHVKWQVRREKGDNAYLLLEWMETGVDVSGSSATKRGYGRELIEEALPYQINARTRFEILDGGVRCSIEIPLRGGEERR